MTLLLACLTFSTSAIAGTPFFDNNSSTSFTPEYLVQEKAIDDDVLQTCGDWGETVKTEDVKKLLSNYPEVIATTIQLAGDMGKHLTIEKMVDIWTAKHAFTHVFCGQPRKDTRGKNKLGGLHYAPRFKQGFAKGWISMCKKGKKVESCIKADTHEYIASEGTYSIPVVFLSKDGDMETKLVSGYNLYMNADEILIEGTLAYLLFSKSLNSGVKDGCFHSVNQSENSGYKKHEAVAAMRPKGLITFYSVGPLGKAYSIENYKTKLSCVTD